MQRQAYPPGPANSPPLHHPVPQHVSTVPMMRSPPPPAGSAGYDSPYGGQNMNQGQQQQQQGNQFMPQFGGFMNDPTAQMGFQVGKGMLNAGQDYVDKNLGGWLSTAALKHYFNVTTSYVIRKLFLVLVPWRHKPWSRQQRPTTGTQDHGAYAVQFLPPREDINSPDMYIPVMAFVTYILLSTLLVGVRGQFNPEVMGSTFGYASVVVLLEILVIRTAIYFLSISNSESGWLGLLAYSGYKFVGVIVTLVISEIFNLGKGTGGWLGWTVFLYTYFANAFFLLRSLKYVLLPDSSGTAQNGMHTVARAQKNARTQFLFLYSYVLQFFFMWILTRQDSSTGKAGKL